MENRFPEIKNALQWGEDKKLIMQRLNLLIC